MHSKHRIKNKNSRLCVLHNLLFFVTLLAACKQESKEIIVVWKDDKATGITIPLRFAEGISKDSIRQYIKIRRLDKDTVDILGFYEIKDQIHFTPMIPFAWGTKYAVFAKNKKAAAFTVDNAYRKDSSQVITIYPQTDTVPENILKIYIRFAHPMREGESSKYIQLVSNNKDTLRNVFLDLQPELWNEDRTVLTVWFDPGRIKRELQPNLVLGAPLHEKNKYRVIVSKEWRDIQGIPLTKSYDWNFTTTHRDSLSPDILKWNLLFEKTRSRQGLVVVPNEQLDHFLLLESLHITDKNGFAIEGKWEMADKDKSCIFTPDKDWPKGECIFRVDSKLEDLAGNNLNRPFDRDIKKTKQPSTQSFYRRTFMSPD